MSEVKTPAQWVKSRKTPSRTLTVLGPHGLAVARINVVGSFTYSTSWPYTLSESPGPV